MIPCTHLSNGEGSNRVVGKRIRQGKCPHVIALPDAVVEPFGCRVRNRIGIHIGIVITRIDAADRLIGNALGSGGDGDAVLIDIVSAVIIVQQSIEGSSASDVLRGQVDRYAAADCTAGKPDSRIAGILWCGGYLKRNSCTLVTRARANRQCVRIDGYIAVHIFIKIDSIKLRCRWCRYRKHADRQGCCCNGQAHLVFLP